MNTQLHVLLIGGYGEFGGRLARLLLRDKHTVIVAGRSEAKAASFCRQYGGTPLQFDLNSDLKNLNQLNVDVVIDAAGPFQSYNDAAEQHRVRYKVVIAAIECGAHYLDLSDDGNFSKGIIALDTLAKQHNKFALSGASSTPALSGAAVSSMQSGFASINKIESTILPGGRAPKGYSVMWAILSQVGNRVSFWRSGEWLACRGWSEPVIKHIGSKLSRSANLIQTADVILFPEYFKVDTVLFRAGLSQSIMHKSVQWLGAVRGVGLLPTLTRFIRPLTWLANSFSFLGSDHGGMLVEVIGKPKSANDQEVGLLRRSEWTLLAEPGEGPFVPAIAARALLRDIDNIRVGARPCINELPLKQFVDAMADIGIVTNTQHKPFSYLFHSSLQEQWLALPQAVRDTHEVMDRKVLMGAAKITRGSSLLTGLIAGIFRFPKAAGNIKVQVTKTRLGNKEIWLRDFGGQQFKSTLRPVTRHPDAADVAVVEEQFGLLKFVLNLPVHDGVMHMNVKSGRCLGIPIPRILLPISNATEFVVNGRMHFSVEIRAPFNLGLIVLYEGSLA